MYSIVCIIDFKSFNNDRVADAFNALALAWRGVNSDSVLQYAKESLRYSGNSYAAGRATALTNLAAGARISADYKTAMDAGLQATRLFDSLGMKAEKADVLLDLAQLYKDISGSNNTETYLDQAIDYAQQSYHIGASIKDTVAMADALNMQGICLRDKSKQYKKRYYYDSAILCYERALWLIEKSGKGLSVQSEALQQYEPGVQRIQTRLQQSPRISFQSC